MSLRQQRIAKGLCPDCGAEAAPYYRCGRCMFANKVRYFLRKAEAAGEIETWRSGRGKRFRATEQLCRAWNNGGDFKTEYLEAEGDDRRLRPRLRNIPVDIERELMAVFERTGNAGVTIEEIYEAWGTLRLRSNRTSAAADMAQIVEAKRRRAEKLARRAERHRKQIEMGQGL